MKKIQLADGLFYCGVLDPDLKVFDIVMHTEFGTTYNSYILKGSEKTVLFETAKAKFFDEYLASVSEITDIGNIDYIVVNHTEPDHAGSVERLIELNPNIKVVGTATAISFLKNIVNHDFYSVTVKENDTLELGGKTLRFMILPNLHWPDTMYTYVEQDAILFTCDSFGSHYSHAGILRSTVTDTQGYMRAAKYYFDNIIGPYKQPYMTNALKRIDGLKLSMICPGHGPVLDSHIDELKAIYAEWCQINNPNSRKTVIIPYVSAYGYTKQLAERIAAGIGDSGDVDVRSYDMVTADPAEVSGEITFADGVLFGTPTIIGEALKPIWELTTSMFSPIHKGKLASAFGSYGWSGEGVPHIIERLKQLRLNVLDGYRVKFKPAENELLDAYEFGYNFGCVLQSKENDRKKGVRTLVKCLVCGEIFDSSLEVCPVCGVGKENFVPADADEITFSSSEKGIFLILGGGAAALNAAKAIRARNKACAVVMLSDEKIPPYNRPMLTKSMLAGFSAGELAVVDETWYNENNVTILTGKRIADVNIDEKLVECDDGSRFAYDKLIYALGADCFIPPIDGAKLPGVVAVRNVEDAERIKRLLPGVKNAVVIGGGVLGLEAAWELRKSKCGVTVVETAQQIMARQLDAGAAELLTKIALTNGVKIITGAKTDAILGADKAEAVRLSDGTELACELVIISCGIRANVELAKKAGVACGRAVTVDSHMRTSIEGVYACGDCAEYNGVNLGLWSQAVEMGRVAGANAAGDNASYTAVSGALTFNGMNTSLFALGDNGKQAGKQYGTVELKDDKRMTMEKYYFLNNRLSGAILIGDTSKLVSLTAAVEENAQFKDIIKF